MLEVSFAHSLTFSFCFPFPYSWFNLFLQINQNLELRSQVFLWSNQFSLRSRLQHTLSHLINVDLIFWNQATDIYDFSKLCSAWFLKTSPFMILEHFMKSIFQKGFHDTKFNIPKHLRKKFKISLKWSFLLSLLLKNDWSSNEEFQFQLEFSFFIKSNYL